jgi:putative membrane protein
MKEAMKRASMPLVAAVVAAAPDWALAQGTDQFEYGPHMMWWGAGWGAMIFGPLFMVVILALVIAIVVLLVRWLGGPWPSTTASHPPQGRAPLDILKERFARGEIDKEEYEERRRVLGE